MFTVRLSWVMTGWGGNDTTCSRRSVRARIRSMNGTMNARPGVWVFWKRPRRSITAAWAWGMICTDLPTAMITSSTNSRTTTSRTVVPSIWSHFLPARTLHSSSAYDFRVLLAGVLPLREHQCRRAGDPHHGDPLPRLDHLDAVERARRPLVVTDPHPPPVPVHARHDGSGPPDQR